jgi:hypothetical protein
MYNSTKEGIKNSHMREFCAGGYSCYKAISILGHDGSISYPAYWTFGELGW